jgi:prolyl oligopeptidase
VIDYPATPRGDVSESYHGTRVDDPYRWLEDMSAPETVEWVERQNRVTQGFLSTMQGRGRLRGRFVELWDFPRRSAPIRRGGWYFYTLNEGLQPQPVLYRVPVDGGEPAVVLDPNGLSADGTIAVMNHSFTRDGALLAYSLAESGSDWQTVRVMDPVSGAVLPDRLDHVKFTSLAWEPGGEAFYYSRYPAPGEMPGSPPSSHQRVYRHAIGTAQSTDELIYARPDAPALGFHPMVTDDGELLVLHVWEGTDSRNRLYYRKLSSGGVFVRLFDGFDAKYELIGHHSGALYLLTERDAPRGRIVAVDLAKPARGWRQVIPESADTLEFSAIVGGHLVTGHLHDAHHLLSVHTVEGRQVRRLELPALGTVTELTGKPRQQEMFVGFQSFLHPPMVLRYDFNTDEFGPFHGATEPGAPPGLVTEQLWARSPDGTRVPVFVTRKRDILLDGTNPTILYGYGGFDISTTPLYGPDRLGFVEAGGVFAVAVLRGGGEYGQEWHHAGMLEKKQNVFDDFIAAAEHLVALEYTSPRHLGIHGRSNGGLLVTACLLQRPELFGAAVAMVPVTDMLRYQHFTAGRYWTPEYGDAEASEVDFRFLIGYSPIHNVVPGAAYPPTLVTTGDTDDRVVPLHSYKFVAALQHAVGGDGIALLRVDTRAGHGLGKPIAKLIDEAADIYEFFLDRLG